MTEPSRDEIWKMFDTISPTYDRVNAIMTFRRDKYWRRKVGDFFPDCEKIELLDCATGTGDQIFTLLEKVVSAVGIDLSEEMIRIAKQKDKEKKVQWGVASALDIPYADESFDCATMSFGIRNVTDVPRCLKEIHRVLKKGGRILILECSLPKNPLVKFGHLFYMRTLLPRIGGWIANNAKAYSYLNRTVETFPSGEHFCKLMEDAGFQKVKANPLTLGVVSIYQGDKE